MTTSSDVRLANLCYTCMRPTQFCICNGALALRYDAGSAACGVRPLSHRARQVRLVRRGSAHLPDPPPAPVPTVGPRRVRFGASASRRPWW